jgi:hypothetical protein
MTKNTGPQVKLLAHCGCGKPATHSHSTLLQEEPMRIIRFVYGCDDHPDGFIEVSATIRS